MQRQNCYSCDANLPVRNLARLLVGGNEVKTAIALDRRNQRRLPPVVVDNNTRICVTCNRTITEDVRLIENDPSCMRLNVLTQSSWSNCLVCDRRDDVQCLSVDARVNIFIKKDIYVPYNVKTCRHHLDPKGLLPVALLADLRYINRPYVIPGNDLQKFLQAFRSVVNTSRDFTNINEYSDEDFKCLTSLIKEQFDDLCQYCEPVPGTGACRHVYEKDVLAFLCKMRQGLSDDLLKVIFSYSTRQAVSLAIATVRKSLLIRFVPQNIGFGAISREEFIERYVSDFANTLYNSNPTEKKAIVVIDGTYAYINKSTNFRALRQSYSVHKGRHLVKPTLIVSTNGYILSVLGPYFSDSKNNDAKILNDLMEKDIDGMKEWFNEGDIVLVDRGYRDSKQLLERLGIQVEMPSLLRPGEKAFLTEEANNTRLVTKSRWIVETRNGHFRSIFKFFKSIIEMPHLEHLNDFYLICGALINKYHPLVEMADANVPFARRMLERSRVPNTVQARVEVDNLIRRRAVWERLIQTELPTFPRLSLNYIRNLTFGPYQVRLAASYVQDKIHHENDEEYELDRLTNEPGFIRVRIYSRFRNSTKHDIFIAFNVREEEEEEEDVDEEDNEPITGYYCTCQSGARILGTCAHVASVLWYLGYARHEDVHYPPTSLLASVSDAAGRSTENDDNEDQ